MYPKQWISYQKASSLLRNNLSLVKRGQLFPVLQQTMMCGHIYGQGYYLTPAEEPKTVHAFMVAVCGPDYANMEFGKRDAMVVAYAETLGWDLHCNGFGMWTLRKEVGRKIIMHSFSTIGGAVKYLIDNDTE